MHIVEDGPDRLALESRPWLLGSFLILVILIMLAVALATVAQEPWLGFGMTLGACLFGVCFVVFVRRVVVIFDRKAGAVVIRTASLLGQTEKSLPIADILKARVDTRVSRSSSSGSGRRSVSRTHAAILVTSGDEVPLTQIYSGGTGAEVAATAINRWLGVTSP